MGFFKSLAKPFKRAAVGIATGGLSELGGAKTAFDLTIGRDIARQEHHASDTAQAEAAAAQAAAEEAERAAAARAGQERRQASRRRGRASTILAGGLGLLSPSPGTAGRTLLGA